MNNLKDGQAVIDLTNMGYVENGEFVGIKYNEKHDMYEVWCANIQRYKRLNTAKKYLSRLCPGWEERLEAVREAEAEAETQTKVFDDGGDTTISTGIAWNRDSKTYTALTPTQSKEFKTRSGAARWLDRRGYSPNGEKKPTESKANRKKITMELTADDAILIKKILLNAVIEKDRFLEAKTQDGTYVIRPHEFLIYDDAIRSALAGFSSFQG